MSAETHVPAQGDPSTMRRDGMRLRGIHVGIWVGVGLVVLVCLLGGLFLLSGVVLRAVSPATGNVFSNIVAALPTQAAAGAEGASAVDASLQQEHLIIRNGSISLVVDDTRAAQTSIEQMVAGMAGEGAFVVSSEERGGTGGQLPYISMNLRVPAARFDEVMDLLAAMAVEVQNRSESAQDVTEEYVDLQARLGSLEAARQRLEQIMQEAKTTQDLLAAEQQLTQREAEIESIKGRMQYLSQSARLSRIAVELTPSALSQPVDTRWHPAETARKSFDALVSSLRGFGDFLIFFGIAILPWLVALALVAYGLWRLIAWWRARRGREKQAPR